VLQITAHTSDTCSKSTHLTVKQLDDAGLIPQPPEKVYLMKVAIHDVHQTVIIMLSTDLILLSTSPILLSTHLILLSATFILLSTSPILLSTHLILLSAIFILLSTSPILLSTLLILLRACLVLLSTLFILLRACLVLLRPYRGQVDHLERVGASFIGHLKSMCVNRVRLFVMGARLEHI
jgi:hypothetical protein